MSEQATLERTDSTTVTETTPPPDTETLGTDGQQAAAQTETAPASDNVIPDDSDTLDVAAISQQVESAKQTADREERNREIEQAVEARLRKEKGEKRSAASTAKLNADRDRVIKAASDEIVAAYAENGLELDPKAANDFAWKHYNALNLTHRQLAADEARDVVVEWAEDQTHDPEGLTAAIAKRPTEALAVAAEFVATHQLKATPLKELPQIKDASLADLIAASPKARKEHDALLKAERALGRAEPATQVTGDEHSTNFASGPKDRADAVLMHARMHPEGKTLTNAEFRAWVRDHPGA